MKRTLPVFSIRILFAISTVIGFALLPLLSIQLLPTAGSHQLTVNYTWPNAAPAVVEQMVTAPLEGAFNLVVGVKKISSISGKGSGTIELELDKAADLDLLRFEIASKIRQLYPQLPQGVGYPIASLKNPDEEQAKRPILTYSLSGRDNPTTLYRFARETLSPQLALNAGMQKIEVQGGNEEEWHIQYDAPQMQALGIRRSNLLTALQRTFRNDALGLIRQQRQSFYIRLAEPPNRASVFKNIAIKKVGRRMVRLAEIATIQRKEAPPTAHYRINGKNSIRLLFYPEQRVNTLRLAKKIKAQIAQIRTALPNDYQLFLDDDATVYLSKELTKIGQRTVFSLGILLLFVLVVYRNFRQLGVLAFSLLANLGLAFIFYYWLNIELHLYALAGITVSFGIIIDNVLVMMHHWHHQRNWRVFPALIAATLTTLAALIIIFFLPEKWQFNLAAFAQVIGVNLGVSLLVAGFLVPALMPQKTDISTKKANRDFSHKRKLVHRQRRYQNLLGFILNWRKTVITLLILAFGLPVFMLPNKMEGWDWYNQTLGSDWYIENVKPQVNKWLGGTLRLFVWYVYEGANYRQPEETVLTVQASMPNGTTLAQMNTLTQQMETYLSQFPVEIKQYVSNVYSGQFAQTQIYFNAGYDFAFPHQLKNRLIAFSINLGGVEWQIYGIGKGFSNGSASMPPRYRLKMLGYNRTQLSQQAKAMAKKLEAHPRVKSVNTEANVNWWAKDLYEYQLTLSKQQLAQQQIYPRQLLPVLTPFNRSIYPDLYSPQGVGVKLVAKDATTKDLWKLSHQPIRLDSQLIQFTDIGQLEKKKVASAIHKENQQYIQLLEWEYTGSARFGNQHLANCQTEMERTLPLGYAMEQANYGSWQQETEQQYVLFLLIIGFIFFISAVQFESFQQAFAIILLIPISFIGIFLTFYWFDFNFDQGGYTAFILLSGLVVNGLILIINDFNYYRKRFPKHSFLQNYTKAFGQKITPILLTIISTILGLIPFLIHGSQEVFWFSLAIGTIGGLVFSILILVCFIPLFLQRKP